MNIEEMMKMQNGGLNIDADSLELLKDVGTVTDEKVVVRMTSLKTNGSVWTKQYEGDINWNEIMP
jgi:hypothetical protein